MREIFRPATLLTTYTTLDVDVTARPKIGSRSSASAFELTWTQLDLQRVPDPRRCCNHCNPQLLAPFSAVTKDDPRLSAYASHFLFPVATPPSRPASAASHHSHRSQQSRQSDFEPLTKSYAVPEEQKEELRRRLVQWREERHRRQGRPSMFSSQIALPPKQLEKIVASCAKFVQQSSVTAKTILNIVKWNSATPSYLEEVIEIVEDWRELAYPGATPTSQRRVRKRQRGTNSTPRAPAPWHAKLWPSPNRILRR